MEYMHGTGKDECLNTDLFIDCIMYHLIPVKGAVALRKKSYKFWMMENGNPPLLPTSHKVETIFDFFLTILILTDTKYDKCNVTLSVPCASMRTACRNEAM